MSLTKAEKLLIEGLQIFQVSEGMAAAIFMTLQTEEQQLAMMGYMIEHEGASGEELLDQARRIAGSL